MEIMRAALWRTQMWMHAISSYLVMIYKNCLFVYRGGDVHHQPTSQPEVERKRFFSLTTLLVFAAGTGQFNSALQIGNCEGIRGIWENKNNKEMVVTYLSDLWDDLECGDCGSEDFANAVRLLLIHYWCNMELIISLGPEHRPCITDDACSTD